MLPDKASGPERPFYARRVRASRREKEGSELPVEAAPTKRRCPPIWARLIGKVYQADPLACKGCGGPLKIVAYITDELSIRRIPDHLGLSPPEQEKPPPTREVSIAIDLYQVEPERQDCMRSTSRPGTRPAPGASPAEAGSASRHGQDPETQKGPRGVAAPRPCRNRATG
jgi:hypothetical protein